MWKCPSGIWRRDLNSRPLGYESPPSTTWPRLPPQQVIRLHLMFLVMKPMSSHFIIWYRNSLKADRPIVERLSERFSVEALKQEQEALTRVEWKEIVPSNDAVLKIGKWWVGKLGKRTPHRSSLVEGDDGLYLSNGKLLCSLKYKTIETVQDNTQIWLTIGQIQAIISFY